MSLLTNVLKLWRTGQYLLPADSGFMVKHLFANGEPGFAKLDFSGFAGMYQDRARTIPYTAVEQTLGSFTGLNGVTATAPADVNRGVVSARVNLLTKTEQFDNAVWVKSWLGAGSAPSVTPNAALAPDGTLTADHVTLAIGGSTSSSDWSWLYQNLPRTAGVSENFAIWVKAATPADVGRVVVLIGASAAVVTLSAEWVRYELPALVTISATFSYGVRLRGNETPGATDVSFHLWGASLTLAADAHLPYQRVNTPTDYDTAGFPHYLKFNGTNTTYTTPSIDFTGTDKMTVWAGVTKLSDAANGIVYEFGSPESVNDGSFSMWAPINLASASLGVTARGLSRSVAATSAFSGVASGVVVQDTSLSAPRNALRLNGATLSTETTALGGSFGNYPLYIGAREGGGLYFNGRLYSLIIRGAQSSLSQIEATENLIRKTMRLP